MGWASLKLGMGRALLTAGYGPEPTLPGKNVDSKSKIKPKRSMILDPGNLFIAYALHAILSQKTVEGRSGHVGARPPVTLLAVKVVAEVVELRVVVCQGSNSHRFLTRRSAAVKTVTIQFALGLGENY